MSILELFESHSGELDHGFIENVDLNLFEENVVQDIMTEVSIPMTIEEEISELQQNGLLDLSDHSDLPCMPGIQATDVGSLLEQFEEVSQTLVDCDFLEPTFDHSQKSDQPKPAKVEKNETTKEKKEMTSEILERLKSSSKRKTAVMLPMGVPAKRGRGRAMPRGRPVAIPASSTPLRLQRVMMQNKELSDCLPSFTPDSLTYPKDRPKDDVLKANENYFEQFDHDYCKPTPEVTEAVQKETVLKEKTSPNENNKDENCNPKHTDSDLSEKKTESGVTFGLADDEIVEDGGCIETETVNCDNSKVVINSNNTWSKRNYRNKRAESPMIESGQYFDKIPTYFTALSIPKKPMRRSASDSLKPGICFQDFLERDSSPVRDTSSYSKLPDYYSTFTNSTKYDKIDKNGNYSQESKASSGYSSRSQSPLVIDSRRPSPTRSRSASNLSSRQTHDRSVSSRREVSKTRSYSSDSRCSSSRSRSRSHSRSMSRSLSRSCSVSSSATSFSNRSRSSSSVSSCSSRSSSSNSSRSRSPSSDRAWKRESDMRGIRCRRSRSYSRHSLSRSRSRSRSRVHIRYRHRSPSYYRSRSRSYSRGRHYRSRSRSYSREAYRDRSREVYRDRSRERLNELRRREEKEKEKRKQNAERRIVYVGCIPDNYTKRRLHRRFEKFGEIENVQLHFREHGDNYGFVTFAYTCDAYAAIEKGNLCHDDVKLDLCFGGRRQFCDEEYADLDGNKEMEEEFDAEPKKANSFDFDELLRQARSKLKKS